MKQRVEGRNLQSYLEELFTTCIGSYKGIEVKILSAVRL